jgi:hypothetical protein
MHKPSNSKMIVIDLVEDDTADTKETVRIIYSR